MTLPTPRPFAWFLGTPEDRSDGGRIALLWGDTVYPYSRPSDLPSWWHCVREDPADSISLCVPVSGQFEGYHRNFAVPPLMGEDEARNFPNDRAGSPAENRFFNCVIPYMVGLKASASAPRRIRSYLDTPNYNESDGPGSKEQWPHRAEDQLAITFLEYYMDNFVDPATTALIVALPVRDVMNCIGDPADSSLFPTPDATAGEIAIREYIRAALTKAKALGIEILGWYLIDEPDFLLFNYWASAAGVARLRLLVRSIEREWRLESTGDVANDPTFLAIPAGELGEAERQARLRPCIITFSSDFANDFPAANPPPRRTERESPTLYAILRAADLYLFDWYPYRRTRGEVESDWSVCGGELPDFGNFAKHTFGDSFPTPDGLSIPMTPKVSLRRFRELRRLLNPIPPSYPPGTRDLLPTDPNYVPVLLWSQAAGAAQIAGSCDDASGPQEAVPPFRAPSTDGLGTSALEPARVPLPNEPGGESCTPTEPSFSRQKRMPCPDDVRYYAWAALFDLSEGFACFGQPGVPDDTLVSNFVPVARELAYFQSLRWDHVNLTAAYVPGHMRMSVQTALPAWDTTFVFPHIFWWARFKNSPGPLQGISLESLFEWLIVINRENSELLVKFDVNQAPTHFPDGDWVLHEWKFLERLDSPADQVIIPIHSSSSTSPQVEFTVPPNRIRLFQLRRRELADPT